MPCRPSKQAKRLLSIIRNLSSSHHLHTAIITFSHLRRNLSHPFSPHLDHPISSLLAASTAVRSFSHGSALHALSLSLALFPANPFTVARVAAFYAACDRLHLARATVEDSTAAFVLPWNIVISACVDKECWKDAIFMYGMMLERGIKPDKFSNSSVLKACGEIGEIGLGEEVCRCVGINDFECDLVVWNAMIVMYAKCGAVDDARKVFDEMPERDVFSWNSIVLGYSCEGRWEELFELVERMRVEGFEINSVGLNTIICGLLYCGNYKEVLRLISCNRERTGICGLDSVSLLLGLKACSDIRCLKQGKEIHGLAIRSGCDELENISNALVTLYSKCGYIGDARIVFERSSARSVVTWNSMIAAFAMMNNFHEAASLLREMIELGTRPSRTTIVTMIALCADSADLWHGKQLQCYAIRHGFEHYLPIANSVVDMYCKSGRVSVAHRVFNMMAGHDRISYTALIAGYASQREGIVVRELIDGMISQGIEPDQVMIEVIRSVWSRRPGIHGGGLCAWNHSSVAALVQHG